MRILHGRGNGPHGVRGCLVALTLLLAGACTQGADAAVGPASPLLVAAASDLRPAFLELGRTFEESTGIPVTFSFGSSGQLAQQLAEGAPMDLYASASDAFVERVLEAGVGDPRTQATYGRGRIVLWAPQASWGGWRGLADIVADPGVRTIAIANPEHAPYGLAARQALEAAGLWSAAEPLLVFGENVADTQRMAATGNADAAIIALSLAIAHDADADGTAGTWILLGEDLHVPLCQDLLVVADDPVRAAVAGDFADHVLGEQGREVLRRFGLLPGGPASPTKEG